MRKRNWAFIIFICMNVMVIGGCGEKANEVTSSSGLSPVKLTYYCFGRRAETQNGEDEVFARANEITKNKINAEIDYKVVEWGEFSQKMTVVMASGEACDLMFTAPWQNKFQINVARGALLPLDDLLKEYAPDVLNSIKPIFWDAAKVNGKIYGVINQQVFPRKSLMVFQKSILEKSGFDINQIETVSDLEKYFEVLKAKGMSPQDYAYTGISGITWQYAYEQALGWEALVSSYIPGTVDSADAKGKVFNQFETTEFKEYIKLMRDWYLKGYFNQMSIDGKMPESTFAMRMSGCFKPGLSQQEEDSMLKAESVLLPYGENIINTLGTNATMTGISSNSKNPERAMMYINLMNTDKELYNLICFGIEGRDYKKIDGDYIELIEKAPYRNVTPWQFGNNFNAYLYKGMSEDAWEQQKKYNDETQLSEIFGFSFDPKAVNTEIANCQAVASQYMSPFRWGQIDIDTSYSEFIEKMKIAGSEKIIIEMQRQVDEFLSSKSR